MDSFSRLTEILSENAQKPFVKRILDKNSYPTLDNKDGTHSTHSMSWSEVDGKYVVFPTVLLEEDKTLKRYPPRQALDSSLENDDFIAFDTPEEADWFSKSYKQVWDMERR